MTRQHRLSATTLEALGSAGDSAPTVGELLSAEYSRRLLLLRILLERGAAAADSAGRLPIGKEAWDLLARAQRQAPERFRQVLLDPQTGAWAARALRSMAQGEEAETAGAVPFWVEFGGLHRLAVSAAALAGLEFSLDVPVVSGHVLLPHLGRVELTSTEAHSTAAVRGGPDGLDVGGVRVPADPEAPAPGWSGLRRLRAECDGQVLDVALDDLGWPPTGGTGTPERLSDEEYADWGLRLEQAWKTLVRDHPDSAAALSTGLLSLAPLPHGERLRPHSATSSDAFGCVVLSAPHPDDEAAAAAELAVTLIHEFRHSVLNGLMRLAPLHDGTDGDLYHAPWRDDPRPLVGLLHGAYAFAGVTAFWRTRRQLDEGPAGQLAHFEFSLWRRQTRAVLDTLRARPGLTAAGRRLVDGLTRELDPWLAESVPEPAATLADLAAAHHRASWRAHHVRPTRSAVEEAAAAVTSGAVPGNVGRSGPTVSTDPDGCRLDVLALLARLRLTDPAAFGRLRDGAEHLPGSSPADLALVTGDLARAETLYAAELDGPGRPARPSAWAGLGLTLRAQGAPAPRLLLDQPELMRAVAAELGDRVTSRELVSLTAGPARG
ncbi:HEXXH motif domain-containing protein [Streptomyces sp. NPDC047043]|uniref:HEXXH motif domain-containing protein n=1 Tax=Streptomyces sp. NPDC047043 TaxID=3154497 RepID=UPI0033E22252